MGRPMYLCSQQRHPSRRHLCKFCGALMISAPIDWHLGFVGLAKTWYLFDWHLGFVRSIGICTNCLTSWFCQVGQNIATAGNSQQYSEDDLLKEDVKAVQVSVFYWGRHPIFLRIWPEMLWYLKPRFINRSFWYHRPGMMKSKCSVSVRRSGEEKILTAITDKSLPFQFQFSYWT